MESVDGNANDGNARAFAPDRTETDGGQTPSAGGLDRPTEQALSRDSHEGVGPVIYPKHEVFEPDLPSPEEYARRRAAYIRAGGGTPPPGATPLPSEDEEPQP